MVQGRSEDTPDGQEWPNVVNGSWRRGLDRATCSMRVMGTYGFSYYTDNTENRGCLGNEAGQGDSDFDRLSVSIYLIALRLLIYKKYIVILDLCSLSINIRVTKVELK